jgi:UDP-N-acetyl-D-glucosamine dehydrogenase
MLSVFQIQRFAFLYVDGGKMSLVEKIKDHSAIIGVIGLGYVGLPLAVLQARTGYRVFGVDEVGGKVKRINRGENYISDVDDAELRTMVTEGRLSATTDFSVLAQCDVVMICVPTPLTRNKEPDISAIVKVTRELAKYVHPDTLVILESTTYPGTTEEVLLPLLTEGGLKIGQSLYLAFSPERVDPGNVAFKTHNTFKLVGGVTPACLAVATAFYEQSIVKIFPLSSPRVAEMTKVFENIFRSVNIALVNELALLCDRMELNVWEVIDAAATKPFGFMKFTPGPGLGGHCIPVDPFYLTWKAREFDLTTRFIELAGEVNTQMPRHVHHLVIRALNRQRKALNGAQVLLLGVAYKPDVDDYREAPVFKIMELLAADGATVVTVDPHVAAFEDHHGQRYQTVPLSDDLLAGADCVVIITDHSAFDYARIVAHSQAVVDTRNATRNVAEGREKIVLL